MIEALLLSALLQSPDAREHVRVDDLDGVQTLTIHARGLSVREFSQETARRLNLRWVNDAGEAEARSVSADIEQRPVRLALEWVYGSAGVAFELRNGILRTYTDEPDREQLEQQALAAYSRALSRFGEAPEADAARSEVLELEHARGNVTGALQHALILAEAGHTLAAQSAGRLQAGRLAEELGRWKEASDHFRALSLLDESNADLQKIAREEMARCLVRLEDYDRARLVVASLDNAYPATTPAEREKRALLRGMAYSGAGSGAEALAALAEVRIELLPPDLRQDATRALAGALEADGRLGEAGKCWMLVSQTAQGDDRLHAIEQAARLALTDGDELGALLACSSVTVAEETTALRVYRDAARSRLGLEREARPEAQSSASERLTEFEHMLAAGRGREALVGLGDLLAEGGRNAPEVLLSARLLRVRALAQSAGLDAGLEAAREARGLALDEAARTRCDLCAADLLEAAGQYGRAADAYEGRY
jgi:hypothetical protein